MNHGGLHREPRKLTLRNNSLHNISSSFLQEEETLGMKSECFFIRSSLIIVVVKDE